jgi:hypothetical protein
MFLGIEKNHGSSFLTETLGVRSGESSLERETVAREF